MATQNQSLPENAFDQLAPFFATTSASASNSVPYDIFINHRGSDVKHTFATALYKTFVRMGLRTFLDKEALEAGDVIPAELQYAITGASLHIAIFSPNYAQSPWCLAELSFMLKTHTKIIPIFYRIKPDDLRWVAQWKGIYAAAFSEHENKGRYTSQKLEEWKLALRDVSYHFGYALSDNEDEGTLLKNIVNCVLPLMKKVPLEVAKHPVGLDKIVQDFEESTRKSAESHQYVQILGIVGMGGSGKTTLSKELFNKNFSSFDRCSFVFEVRAGKDALHNKPKRLLEDLGVGHSSFDNVEEGRAILSNHLRSVRALVVLDDVDHVDQLDALLPHPNNLSSDTMVIITTRDLGVLTSWGISCNYHMPGMNRSHGEQLFCWHAFLRPSPPVGFKTLVEKFFMASNGLPLSLRVLGGQLYGRMSKDYWESLLNKISRILPEDIKQRLQVSYDALDEEDKQTFLDVACFFIGEQKSLAIAVWDGSGWSGLHSWETLVNKCLVEPDEKNSIKMHDHLRDMGREIAYKHSPYRLRDPNQILDIRSQERTLIRGIANSVLDFMPFKEHMFHARHKGNSKGRSKRLRSSLGLNILHVGYNGRFTEEFASLSEDLLWLRWHGVRQQRNLPSWVSLRNLSVLELYDIEQLQDLWEDNVEPPLQLRELRIHPRDSSINVLQRLPSSIGCLKQLKMLKINWCFRGSSLPEEFCGLQSLEHLELSFSKMLSSLPARFGDLANLRHIDLQGCRRMEGLPDSFKHLIHLEYLNLESCTKLRLRLDMLENITKLQYLNLGYCGELEELPYQITSQASLRKLHLQYTKLRYIPTNLGQLGKLEDLGIGSPLLTSLPTSLGNLSSLTTLSIANNTSPLLTSLPASIGNMSSLTTLCISHCENLEYLPSSMARLNLLKTVYISYVGVRELPFGGWLSSSSMTLTCEECCPNLQTLSLSYFPQLMDIGMLPISLNELHLTECKMLKNVRAICGLVNLEKLEMLDCPMLDDLPSFANLVSLKEFVILGCPKVEKIEGLEHCRSLEKLIAYTYWEAPGIQSLENLERLKSIDLICETISALKPCIQSMKEFPRQLEIRGKVVRILKPVIKSLEFLDLIVMEVETTSDIEENITEHSFNVASVLCYGEYVHEEGSHNEEGEKSYDDEGEYQEGEYNEYDEEQCVEGEESDDEEGEYVEDDGEGQCEEGQDNDDEEGQYLQDDEEEQFGEREEGNDEEGEEVNYEDIHYREGEEVNDEEGECMEGKVAHIAVFRQAEWYDAQGHFYERHGSNGNFVGLVVMGEESRILEAFYQLFALLE